MGLEDTSGHALWMPNVQVGPGGLLCGLPLLINDGSPQLGTEGDLALLNLQYYYIKDGSPLAISSIRIRRRSTACPAFTFFWNVDGQPMLKTPILQRNGTSTVSPFVLLK